MSLDSDNVRVAVTGVVAVGPTTATAPTDANTPLNVGNEVQTVTITGTPTGGTFTLTYSGQTTTAIAYNATAAAVQAALVALSNLNTGDVTVSGTNPAFTVTFKLNENVAEMTASGASLSGGTTPSVTVATTTGGGGGFSSLGLVSEDGVAESRERGTEEIRAWQNGDVVRETVTDSNLTYTFTLLETKKETLELYYGTKVQPDGSITIVPAQTGGRQSFVIDVVDGDKYLRTYIPSGEVTEVGEITYANGEPVSYEITIRAYVTPSLVDADTGNNGAARKWHSSLVAA